MCDNVFKKGLKQFLKENFLPFSAFIIVVVE